MDGEKRPNVLGKCESVEPDQTFPFGMLVFPKTERVVKGGRHFDVHTSADWGRKSV